MMKRYIRAIGVWIGALSIGMAAIGCQVGVVESQQLTAKAVKSFENGHFETATSTLQQALDRDPNNGDALYWLARIDMKYQDYQAAQLKLQSALGIAPDISTPPSAHLDRVRAPPKTTSIAIATTPRRI